MQNRNCNDKNSCGTFDSKPAEIKTCDGTCVENIECSEWNSCNNRSKTRTCQDLNGCSGAINEETVSCSLFEGWFKFRGDFGEIKAKVTGNFIEFKEVVEENPTVIALLIAFSAAILGFLGYDLYLSYKNGRKKIKKTSGGLKYIQLNPFD